MNIYRKKIEFLRKEKKKEMECNETQDTNRKFRIHTDFECVGVFTKQEGKRVLKFYVLTLHNTMWEYKFQPFFYHPITKLSQ